MRNNKIENVRLFQFILSDIHGAQLVGDSSVKKDINLPVIRACQTLNDYCNYLLGKPRFEEYEESE